MSAALQLGLLSWSPPTAVAGPDAPEQAQQLARVASGIEAEVYRFCAESVGREFHLRDLTDAVTAAHDGYVAPDSPARLLRLLRQRGLVQVALVSRSSSLYRIDGVAQVSP